MARKPKFKPEIRRVRLNPEQAVLACACYSTGYRLSGALGQSFASVANYCSVRALDSTANICFVTSGAGSPETQTGATSS